MKPPLKIELSPHSASLSALLRRVPTIKELSNKTIVKDKEESELKQQVLSSLLSEENPIEGFQKYLDLLILKKTGKESKTLNINTSLYANKMLSEIYKDSATLKIQEKLDQRVESLQSSGRMGNQDSRLQDAEFDELRQLQEIRKKNNLIIHTSRKLKERMKLVKLDKEKLFNQRTMKHFSNLDTFINAKEFLSQINPLNKKDSVLSDRLRSLRLVKSIKKFQGDISRFFDVKINEFMTRISEDEFLSKIPQAGGGDDKQSQSESSEDSKENLEEQLREKEIMEQNQYFKKLYDKVLYKKTDNDQETPLMLSSNQKSQRVAFEKLEKQKEVFKTLNHNSVFMRKNMGENNPFMKAFEELYSPLSMIKRAKNIKEEKEGLNSDLMRRLIITDPGLNLHDFQNETEVSTTNDAFYDKTMMKFAWESPSPHKRPKLINKASERSAISSLESMVHEIIHDKKKRNKKQEDQEEIAGKYKEFKEKSSNILKLINKTSKLIFNEKNKAFSDKKLAEFQREQNSLPNKMKDFRRKAITFDQLSFGLDNPLFPLRKSYKKSNLSIFWDRLSPVQSCSKADNRSLKKHEKASSLHVFSGFLTNSDPISKPGQGHGKKHVLAKLEAIMNQTEQVKNMFKEEKEVITKIQKEAQTFFLNQKIRLKPPLESLAMTFDPVKIKNYHRSTRSMIKDKVRKERMKLFAGSRNEKDETF